jgi:uncharacterized protein (TIGR02145 family)
MMVFVSDESKMVYYDGQGWVTTGGECFPQPSVANAGEDQEDVEGTSTLLAAGSPKFGTGVWSIISEENGQITNISDIYDPQALLETTGGNFVLQWTITNECGESSDQVYITFCPDNTIALAGDDQLDIIGTTAQMSANMPDVGNAGVWSVESGNGGEFSDPNDPNALFTGLPGEIYTLRWTMSTGCEFNFDELQVGFCYTLTIAEAGPDQINVEGTSTALAGNEPGVGNTGLWTVVSGQGGVIDSPEQYNSIFNGTPDSTYVLRWTTDSGCEESYDEVTIYFCPVLTIADAGPDQTDIDGVSVQLAANTPGSSNNGMWAIESSFGPMTTGDEFVDPTDPQTIFNGVAGTTYTLSWTISTVCDESVDFVTISFCPVLDIADAGIDELSACLPYVLSANEPGEGNVGEWSVITGTGFAFCSVHNPTAAFSGSPGATYELVWTISNTCGFSSDTVIVSFDVYPTTALAGPDQLNVEGTTLTLAANTPSFGTGLWIILSGEGGSFVDATDPGTEFSGQIAETYELEWRISTNCYSSADVVTVSFMAVFVCGNDFVDPRDEQVYPTKLIDDQCWMAKNLNVGVQIFTGTFPSNNGIIEKFCYNNLPANCETYGGYYQWNEAMNYTLTEGSQGICPAGWHIPTDADWAALISHVGDSASCKLRIVGDEYWTSNECATDEFNFSALAGGRITGVSTYIGLYTNAYLWTSTQSTSDRTYQYAFFNTSVDLFRISQPRGDGLSIRCIKSN